MTTALEGGEWSAAHPGRALPPGKTWYPLYRKLGGPQGRSGRAENLAPPGFDPWTVQPVVSRYIDWATRPTTHSIYHVLIHNIASVSSIAVTSIVILSYTLKLWLKSSGRRPDGISLVIWVRMYIWKGKVHTIMPTETLESIAAIIFLCL